MKRIATSVSTVALACLGMLVDAKGATNNDRFYLVGIDPSTVASGALGKPGYTVTVTNNRLSGPLHPIKQIVITVPAAFTFAGTAAAVSLPDPNQRKVGSVSGPNIMITANALHTG